MTDVHRDEKAHKESNLAEKSQKIIQGITMQVKNHDCVHV